MQVEARRDAEGVDFQVERALKAEQERDDFKRSIKVKVDDQIAMRKLTDQLAGLLAFAVENMDSVSGGTLYSQCSTCEFDDHKSNHAEGCPSADWHNRAAAALSAYRAREKEAGQSEGGSR